MPDIVLQRFYKFKETFVESNLPNSVLLELLESFIKSDAENMAAEDITVLDGQLSLFDLAV